MKINEIIQALHKMRGYLVKFSRSLEVPDKSVVTLQLRQHHAINFEILDDPNEIEKWEELFCGNDIIRLLELRNTTNCALFAMRGETRRYYQIYYAIRLIYHIINAIKEYRSDGLVLCIDDVDMVFSYFERGMAITEGYGSEYRNCIVALCDICKFINLNPITRDPENDSILRLGFAKALSAN